MKIKVRHEQKPVQGLKIKKPVIRSLAIILAGVTLSGLGLGLGLNQQNNANAAKGTQAPKGMQINPAYENYTQAENVKNDTKKTHKNGVVPSKYIPKQKEGTKKVGAKKSPKIVRGSSNATTLPAQYNLIDEGYGTKLKNQGQDGICWAYTITSAAESYLKKNGIADVEFSPKQLDYAYLSNGLFKDYLEIDDRVLGDGSNFNDISVGLASGFVPVSEASFFNRLKATNPTLSNFSSWNEYANFTDIASEFSNYMVDMNNHIVFSGFQFDLGPLFDEAMSFDELTSDRAEYLITDFSELPVGSSEFDIAAIKSSILKNGAAYVETVGPSEGELCWDDDSRTIIDKGYYKCDEPGLHAMTVVGWDDNYAYIDPEDNTEKHGAFILQNSWGEDNLWTDYIEKNGLDYDSLVAKGGINNRGLNEAQNQAFKKFIEEEVIPEVIEGIGDFSAYETIYLAYPNPVENTIVIDYDGEEAMEFSPTSFGLITGMRANDYDKIYNVFMNDGYDGVSTTDDDSNDLIFEYDTNGKETEIQSVAFYGRYPSTGRCEISIDGGDGYENVGTVATTDEFMSLQQTIDLAAPVAVSGKFNIKLEFFDEDDEPSYIDEDDIPYYTITAYGKETSTGTGNTNVIKGQTSYTAGENTTDLVIKIDRPISTFNKLLIDGVEVDRANYGLKSGSTIITINRDYLNTLGVGSHTINALFNNTASSSVGLNIIASGGTDPTDPSDPTDPASGDDEEITPVPDTGTDDEGSVSVPDTGANTKNSDSTMSVYGYALPAVFALTVVILLITKKSRHHIDFTKK